MTKIIYNTEFVKDLFDRMSGSYEKMNYITSFGFSIRWRKQFIQHFNYTDESLNVIDLMTGMGETWQILKNKFPNASITAMDFSSKMIEKASIKNDKYFDSKILLIENDVLINALKSESYDIVTCAFGLKTFDNEQLKILANQTKRILKKGGKFSFIEVSSPNNFIFNKIYCFYLYKIIPVLGKLFLGSPAEYKMLWKYTYRFKNAQVATDIFNEIGLKTKFFSLFFGCASGFKGVKT